MCPWANRFTCSPAGKSGGNLDCCWLLPGTTDLRTLERRRKKTAGFLKAKEKAIKCNGCSLNRAWSFLMVPGCGQDIVLVDLMSGLSCGAAKCCAPSLYRRSTGSSAAYVALTSLYILGKSINISQRLIANAATKNTQVKNCCIFTHHFFYVCFSCQWYIITAAARGLLTAGEDGIQTKGCDYRTTPTTARTSF